MGKDWQVRVGKLYGKLKEGPGPCISQRKFSMGHQRKFQVMMSARIYKNAPAVTDCHLHFEISPVDNFGTVVGENPSCYGNLPLWAVNGLSIVCWEITSDSSKTLNYLPFNHFNDTRLVMRQKQQRSATFGHSCLSLTLIVRDLQPNSK